MTNIGDFGEESGTEQIELTFGYFGAELHVNPDFALASYIDFLEAAGLLDEGKDVSELVAIKTMLVQLVAEDDFAKFWRLVKRNRQGAEQLAKLVKALVEAITDLPTRKPSSSSDGRQSTGGNSEPADSSPPGRGSARRADAVAQLEREGRPDLALSLARDDDGPGVD